MKTLDLTQFPILQEIGQMADDQNVEVYAVGGFVRDFILGKASKDIDFVVVGDGPAFAQQVSKRLSASQVVVYKKFGTALVEIADYKLEFVGARSESYRSASRKPRVEPADLPTDLARRDFTINAMAVALNKSTYGKVTDPLGGLPDLQQGLIRTPLDPLTTFSDDPLRILRAIRFATQIDIEIEEKTRAAMREMGKRLKIVSTERITDEFMKILQSSKPSKGFLLMDETRLLSVIFPEMLALKGVEQIDGHHHKDVFYHTLKVVDNVALVSNKLALRYAALVHDIAKPRTKYFVKNKGWTFHNHEEIGARMLPAIGSRMRLPKEMTKYAQHLTRLHLRPISLTEKDVTDSAYRRLLVQAGDLLDDLLMLCRADITSQNPRRVQKHLDNFDFVVQRLHEVEEKDRLRAFQSPVRGEEIMQVCGLKPGPEVGHIKKRIEEAILEGVIPNAHEEALKYLIKLVKQGEI